ncbi:MAG: thioredoxin family protein [Burkholderiales bacterium]|nr:thioredoxin family protein [Burkholderiales bacterium]MDE2452135.1 thioredoxin family protein [Burkholderiales bacterium]
MKLVKTIVAALMVGSAALAHALDIKPYTPQALAQAEAGGQPLALHFRADWCPTCRAQDKVFQSMKSEKGLDLTILSVNYDTERALERRFRINSQSTLVVLKGQKEVARLVGDTSAADLRQALKAAL